MKAESLQINNPHELQDAFKAFNDLSTQLSSSYFALEEQVATLTEELVASKSERIKELQEKEQLAKRLESILQALPAGVVVLDGEGIIKSYNAIALELLGEPLEQQSWNSVSQRVFDIKNSQHEIALKNGRWVTLSTCPLGEEPGQIILLNDVTEQKVLQNNLSQQQRLVTMGQTAASLAHQIRTPLSSAILYSSNLKRQNLTNDDRAVLSEKLMARLRHLEHLVNDMLMYARGSNLSNTVFSLSDLVAELMQTIETHIEASHTHFEWQNKVNGDVFLKGNRQMLISSLINLFVNAIQAMGENGNLLLKTGLNKNNLMIEIQDNGAGIKDENIENVFEPFFTTRSDGTGLGLAVVRAVIHAHSGDISVAQVKPQGTIFNIQIPVFEEDNEIQIQQSA
ncbi:Flagellar sensor histidine kinase FleS [hydrothermal vent metagenome]|uniref:Flagellar sensor histidine kinase FleS n=1 Tax=hydrothermal vent metagenome TaxID=652676 RepID=A0A3B0ZXE9_9ZZZZ